MIIIMIIGMLESGDQNGLMDMGLNWLDGGHVGESMMCWPYRRCAVMNLGDRDWLIVCWVGRVGIVHFVCNTSSLEYYIILYYD